MQSIDSHLSTRPRFVAEIRPRPCLGFFLLHDQRPCMIQRPRPGLYILHGQRGRPSIIIPAASGVNPEPTRPDEQSCLIGAILVNAKSGNEYQIKATIGSGANGQAFRALCLSSNNQEVAIKRLDLKSSSWKQLELFQREAKVLSSLHHPSIPRYIEYFEDNGSGFYLVQELVQGLNLAEMIERGMRASDDDATRIAIALLETCQYLANLRPSVVHRDIKPSNIVIEGGDWGGRVCLVDFGGVQGLAADADLSSNTLTFVGTFGYLSPEQFRNQAIPASDLYSVGATLLFLLTGRDPSAIPQERMRLKWREVLPMPGIKWSRILDGLLDPVAEDRMSAKDALAILQGKDLEVKPRTPFGRKNGSNEPSRIEDQMWRRGVVLPGSAKKPQRTRVVLERTSNRLDICIPAQGMNMDTAMTGAFAIAWNSFVGIWTVGALASGGVLFALFSLPFWLAGAQLGKNAVFGALMRERFGVGLNKFRLVSELALLNSNGSRASFEEGSAQGVKEGSTSELRGAKIVITAVADNDNSSPQTAIEILGANDVYRFGETLDLPEQQWVVSEVNSFLEESRGQVLDYESFPLNQQAIGSLISSESLYYSSGGINPLLLMEGSSLMSVGDQTREDLDPEDWGSVGSPGMSDEPHETSGEDTS